MKLLKLCTYNCVLQTYAVSIFQTLEAPIDKYYATLILGILQLLGASICVLLVHYTGKRPLTFFSTVTAGICCFLVAGYDGYNKTVRVNRFFFITIVINDITLLVINYIIMFSLIMIYFAALCKQRYIEFEQN